MPAFTWAQPALSGSFRAEPLGQLELGTTGERLSGTVAAGNVCRFQGKRVVLEGAFEGSVLVGSLTLCQTGPSCEPERTYPVLAIYNPTSGNLTAHVRLQPGCQSPALLGSRLVLQPAVTPQAPAEDTEGAAALVARKRTVSTQETIDRYLKDGDAAFKAGDYDRAARIFETVRSLEPDNKFAHHGLGGSLLFLGKPVEAIKLLERARNLGLDRNWEVPYLLACAHGRLGKKKQGLDYLRLSLRLGYPVDLKPLSQETDLQTLVGSEAELQALAQQVRRKQGARERQASPEP
ncbi:tetratricopeptide repeat protein [Myxococcaceae bacterium GXIMD 01537]